MGRRGQWHLLLPDIIAQINNRVHTATGVTPNEAYSNPDKAEQAWNSMQSRAKDTAEPRAMVQAGGSRQDPLETSGGPRIVPRERTQVVGEGLQSLWAWSTAAWARAIAWKAGPNLWSGGTLGRFLQTRMSGPGA